jgi:hypothetical protein
MTPTPRPAEDDPNLFNAYGLMADSTPEPLTRRQKIIVTVGIAVTCALVAFGSWWYNPEGRLAPDNAPTSTTAPATPTAERN